MQTFQDGVEVIIERFVEKYMDPSLVDIEKGPVSTMREISKTKHPDSQT